MAAIDPRRVTTALELPGLRIVSSAGVVRGIVVRSRSIVGSIGASLQTLVGGNITLYTQLCERARVWHGCGCGTRGRSTVGHSRHGVL